MNFEKQFKKIDNEFIKLILAGKFELINRTEHNISINCEGFKLTFWIHGGEESFSTYEHESKFLTDDRTPQYAINNLSKKRELYRVLIKVRDTVAEEKALNEKREQYKKLGKELGVEE